LDPGASGKRRQIRWWPALVILLLTLGGITGIRLRSSLSHQQQNILTVEVCAAAVLFLTIWTLFVSRFTWRVRIASVAVLACVIGAGASLFRIRGVSGDLLPVLEWRLRPKQWTTRARLTEHSRPRTAAPPPAPAPTPRGDYPQFLGPHRDGKVPSLALERDWAARPPKLLWRQAIGAAWSGFAVSGRFAVTQEQHGDEEAAVCYDLHSGHELWSHADAAHYQTTIAGEGPRATPAIAGHRVFTMGAMGRLNCLDLESGHVLWSKDVPRDNQGEVGEWGASCSPLVLERAVIVTTGAKDGRSLVAYDRDTGARLWTDGSDRASYSSPATAVLAGSSQILVFNSRSVAGHDAQTGGVLWTHPWPAAHPHIATPVVLSNDRVLVSSGYGIGSELLRIQHAAPDLWRAERIWKSIRLKSKFANIICVHDQIYGLDDGILACLDAATGELRWKEGRYGHGQMILCGALLLIMAENGEVVLVEPVPEHRRELTRFQALAGKTWNPPALAGECLLVRNDLEAACYVLPMADDRR
jgi:outer membrane protein assembly factor BamB